MATNDSSVYQVRFNTVLGILEYAVGNDWVAVPVVLPGPGTITVAMIDSGAAVVGTVLTADGAGGAAFL